MKNKEERFKKVGERRVQHVLDSLRRLSQCSNKRMYQWNDGQLKKIWAAIDGAVEKCKKSFSNSGADEFKL
jgi:hypothetical protein